jgi:hypothetical protein
VILASRVPVAAVSAVPERATEIGSCTGLPTTGVVVAEVVFVNVSVVAPAAAFAGATDRTPAPNAVTATSAMRL